MDKQKRIEEMEKDIAVRMAMAKGVAGSMNNGVEGWLSEYLYNAGYRKIPENAVVLTREEYEKHKGFSREEVDEISKTTIKNSRKETTKEYGIEVN